MPPTAPDSVLEVRPGPGPRSVRDPDGNVLHAPADWDLLPPGDAGLTRRVKAGGACWVVSEKRGKRRFSRGIWAPRRRIEAARAAIAEQRADPAYQRAAESRKRSRDRAQSAYVKEFEGEVRAFLGFASAHRALEQELARAVAELATPVGSGTVARTKRIPVERRAEAAVIAWLRHQTTGYDHMQIARVKGRRREVRRELAKRSRSLLQRYRPGGEAPSPCPLRRALDESAEPKKQLIPVKEGPAADPRTRPARRTVRKSAPAARPTGRTVGPARRTRGAVADGASLFRSLTED